MQALKQKQGLGIQVPPLEAHVKIYFDQQGMPEQQAEKFYRHYQNQHWKNDNGYPVRNWKTEASKWIWDIQVHNIHSRFKWNDQ